MKKECVAMLLAGGQGSRLYVLTKDMAKPAVAFGGKFRIIDFPLSNCSNSGIDTVGVLTQYRPLELNGYIGSGQPWDLDSSVGGVHILPPYMSSKGGTWFKGTANLGHRGQGRPSELFRPDAWSHCGPRCRGGVCNPGGAVQRREGLPHRGFPGPGPAGGLGTHGPGTGLQSPGGTRGAGRQDAGSEW